MGNSKLYPSQKDNDSSVQNSNKLNKPNYNTNLNYHQKNISPSFNNLAENEHIDNNRTEPNLCQCKHAYLMHLSGTPLRIKGPWAGDPHFYTRSSILNAKNELCQCPQSGDPHFYPSETGCLSRIAAHSLLGKHCILSKSEAGILTNMQQFSRKQ